MDNCKELWKEDLFPTLVQKCNCDEFKAILNDFFTKTNNLNIIRTPCCDQMSGFIQQLHVFLSSSRDISPAVRYI